MSRNPPRVLIVFNEPVLPVGHPHAASEADIIETVAEVQKVLPPNEFIVESFGYSRGPRRLLDKIEEWKPDVVFNLFEGEADRTATEIFHTGILEWMNVPFTGSSSSAMAFGRDKVRTKYLLQGAAIDTAPFQVAESLVVGHWPHAWPAIVKPATQDASVGIEQASVVTSQEQMEARVALVLEEFGGPVIIEQFVPGRELHVNLFDDPKTGRPRVVPPSEVRFEAGPDYWPIYSYQGKWNEDSVEFKKSPLDTELVLPSPLAERVTDVCVAAYQLLGMRDYGRVDVRITPEGRPFVLEVNPNPYLNSIILVEGLRRLDISFTAFIQNMVRSALARRTAAR